MSPLLVFAQVCRTCDKRWLSITTQAKPDDHCWACWSTDVHIVGRPKRWETPHDRVDSKDDKAPRRRANDPGHGPQE